MESRINYTLVGIVVLILFASLLSVGLWLSVGFERKQYDTYIVYVSDPVAGLSDDSPVKFNGVKVGFVHDISINPLDPQQVKLELKIERGTPVTVSTHATLISQGITGTYYLGLAANTSNLFPIQKTPGEPYPVIPYKPSFFSELESNVEELSSNIKRIFDKDNIHAFKEILHNIARITDSISSNDKALKRTIKDLPNLITTVQKAFSTFNVMSQSVYQASDKVSSAMQAGERGMDQFSQQTLPPLNMLLLRLNLLALSLQDLTTQLKENPSIIFRGVTPKKPGPGEGKHFE